jgi:hypothetical protein
VADDDGLDEALGAALQAAHNLEATASEKWHKQEHQFKDGETQYPKLGKWFDRAHKAAYDRQHDLRKQMMRFGYYVETELGATDYTEDAKEAFEQACDLLDELMDAHLAVSAAAKAVGGRKGKAIREAFHGYLAALECIYKDGEAKQRQIKDLGLAGFLALCV